MTYEETDDTPQWCWAVGGVATVEESDPAGDRFVVASGQNELWARVRREVEPNEQCAWRGFGPANGEATLADCFRVFFKAREVYGANLNRVILELAQVPAFARYLREAPYDICSSISNPIT